MPPGSSLEDIDGSRLDLVSFFRLIDKTPGTFDIVTP